MSLKGFMVPEVVYLKLHFQSKYNKYKILKRDQAISRINMSLYKFYGEFWKDAAPWTLLDFSPDEQMVIAKVPKLCFSHFTTALNMCPSLSESSNDVDDLNIEINSSAPFLLQL